MRDVPHSMGTPSVPGLGRAYFSRWRGGQLRRMSDAIPTFCNPQNIPGAEGVRRTMCRRTKTASSGWRLSVDGYY